MFHPRLDSTPYCISQFGRERRWAGISSFEPDIVSVCLDRTQLHLEPGQAVIPHGPDRELTVAEALPRGKRA
jgi:hypothetical protein